MSKTKHFFWLRFKEDFFNQKEIKKLRRIAGGDTFTIIYLKMQLLSVKNEGVLTYDATEENLAEQLSLEIDEDIDNIRITLDYLSANNLIERVADDNFLLNKVPPLIGNETDSAERMRKLRAIPITESNKASLCSPIVSNSDTELELKLEKDIKLKIKKEPKKLAKPELIFSQTLSGRKTEALKKFETYRQKEKHVKLTQHALDLIVTKYGSFSDEEIEQAVDVAITGGYQGLFPKKGKQQFSETRERYSLDIDKYDKL